MRSVIDQQTLEQRILGRWRDAAEELRRGGRSLPECAEGLATGSNGRALYRLTLEQAAQIAAQAMAGTGGG